MAQGATYSFLNTSGGFTHPLTDPFPFAGQIGEGQFVISMHTEQSVLATASDGTVMPSAIAGDSGSISIEMQQTSILHRFLLDWFNKINTAKKAGDSSTWAAGAISLVNTTDGSAHLLTGVCPTKIPDKTYAGQGQNLTWVLQACDVQNM